MATETDTGIISPDPCPVLQFVACHKSYFSKHILSDNIWISQVSTCKDTFSWFHLWATTYKLTKSNTVQKYCNRVKFEQHGQHQMPFKEAKKYQVIMKYGKMIIIMIWMLSLAMPYSSKTQPNISFTFLFYRPFRSFQIVIRLFEFPNVFLNFFSNSFKLGYFIL